MHTRNDLDGLKMSNILTRNAPNWLKVALFRPDNAFCEKVFEISTNACMNAMTVASAPILKSENSCA